MENEFLLKEKIKALEEKLNQAAVRKSPSGLTGLLSEDFIEFGSSGKVYSRQEVIELLMHESEGQIDLEDFNIEMLSGDVALVTYKASAYDGQTLKTIYSLRSSIWKLINDRWQLVFHQGTKIP